MNRKIKNRLNSKMIAIWLVFMVIFMMELLTYAWCRVQCIRSGYELSAVRDRQKALLLLQDNLKIEIAHLKSPARIARIAKDQLGLKMPESNQLIVIP